MAYTPQLLPTPRSSAGLIDAYTDIIGGDYVEQNVAGNQTNLNFNGQQAQFTVYSGGASGKQITVPQSWIGGDITWVRGVYAISATPRYNNFMADFSSGDTTNYADFTKSAQNIYGAMSFNVTGNGVTTVFTMPPIYGAKLTGLYKTDWRGRQLQYTTARTNLLKYSQDFTNAIWIMIGTGSATIVGTAPDGTNTACILADTDAALDKAQFNQNLAVTNNSAQYEYSVFLKAGTATQSMLSLYFVGGTTASHLVPIIWNAGVPVYSGGAIGATNIQITSIGSGWYRIAFTCANNSTGNTTAVFRIYPASITAGNTGNVSAWGAQLEAGNTPTSYIPTTSTPVTVTDYSLSADTITMSSAPLAGVVLDATFSDATKSYYTTIPVASSVAVGTVMQAYYSYRSNTKTVKGQAISGWPMKHIDTYQGTANDGDCYMMDVLYDAYRVTGEGKYKALADKIGYALLDAGVWSSNEVRFDIPFDGEAGQFGIYWYNAPATPFSISVAANPDGSGGNALRISTTVTAGNYAGVGIWPTFQVTSISPFNSFDFGLWGDGSARNLLFQMTIASGNVSYLVPLMPADAAKWKQHAITPANLWLTNNVVYDAQHKDYQYTTPYGSNTFSMSDYVDTVNGYIIKQFSWNFTGNPSGYAGYAFGPATVTSAGTTALNFDFYASVPGTYSFTAKDATLASYVVNVVMVAGWNTGISIPWATFSAGFTHPVNTLYVDVPLAIPTGSVRLNNCRYDTVTTMAASTYTTINGFQFSFPSNAGGAYNIYFDRWYVNQNTIDGPVADPKRYEGIPRWTYKWVKNGDLVGYGSWRGQTGCGYLWLGGWYSSGIANHGNSKVISTAMLDFLEDSQNAYKTQFPAQTKGPFINLYGRTSWEAITTGGYVAGSPVSSTINQFYFDSTSDWYGYNYRALLSVAKYYYLTASAQAKVILDNWMAWLNVKALVDGAYWKVPSEFFNDGTLGYSYNPVYAFAVIAQACIYKYFVDGDSIALTWYRRLLDTIYANKRLTATGGLAGIYPGEEGSGYTTATVNFVVNAGATAPTATAYLAGGKVTHYVVTSPGSGITSISMSVGGDGAGATGFPYLKDLLVGAFSDEHTGWEAPEIYCAYALLVNGPPPGGHANHTLASGPNDLTAMTGLYDFYVRNTTDSRPSMMTAAFMPLHEYDVNSYHWGTAIENPMIRDTHVKGAMWTETIAPTMRMAVEIYRYNGSVTWLDQLYNLLLEFTGGTAPKVSNYFVPNAVSKRSESWPGSITFMQSERQQ